MKTRLRHTSKRKQVFQVIFLSVLVIAIGMLVPRIFSGLAAVIMYPIHSTNTWLAESSSLIPVFIRDRQSLENEIESLKNQIVVISGSDVTQQRLLEENNRLRQLLGANTETRVAAAVIARPDELPYDLLQVDRGSTHGVEIGAPVFIGEDIVIGLVIHTAPTYSFVELITTPDFQATAFISGPNVVATLEGMGGGVARVRVPQGVPLAVGNLVYLPSIEPSVFGRISHIENRPTQPEQYGYISPDTSIYSLYHVTIGKQSQISQSASEIEGRIFEQMRTALLLPDVKLDVMATSSTSTADTVDDSEE